MKDANDSGGTDGCGDNDDNAEFGFWEGVFVGLAIATAWILIVGNKIYN